MGDIAIGVFQMDAAPSIVLLDEIYNFPTASLISTRNNLTVFQQ